MPSLANAIRMYQRGGVSHNEFFAQVDRALSADRVEPTQLLEILDDEQTRGHLPPEVYAELQRRVERVVEATTRSFGSDPTRMQPGMQPGMHQHTHPSMRPSMQPQPGRRVVPPSAVDTGSPAGTTDGLERIKGVGDTLNNRFVLEECVGFGGMGTVYRALDLRKLEASDRNPYIAIKVLNVQFRGHPKSLIALQREAKKAQALAHPNIVRVYDFDRDGPMVYLTMEYLQGGPLSRVLRAPGFKGMPYDEAMHIVRGVGNALAYAHERGFVHCDLKPANVFLTDSGEVKVIDFGIARVFHKPEEEVEATVFDPGSLGAMTPAYASPEMLENRETDPRDDMYALACITYEVLTGRHPFDRLPATQARNAGLKPVRPQHLNHRQWRALRCALSFERESRTPNIAQFLQQMTGERRGMHYAAYGSAGLAAAVLVALALHYYRSEPAALPPSPPAVIADTSPPKAAAPAPPAPAPAASAPAAPSARTAPPPAPAPAPAPAPVLTLDAVSRALAGIPCSALVPAVRDGAVQVRGYLQASYGTAKLKEALASLPGAKSVNLDVQQISDEKCAVVNMLAPYWARNKTAGGNATLRPKQGRAEFAEGESLVLDVSTPAYDSFVNVDYYAFDGSVLHMLPSPRAKANQAPPNYSATIGSMGNWVVAPPFGTDLAVLLITPAPLFDGLRPEHETAANYLQAVERQLKQIAAKYGKEKILVDFLQITTKEKK
ncbi:MAG TPA: protein kinase [Noviherbaspirillum sp.]|uniref:serine/threonine protein kinase n=1 Tax=Noviherbaspirillum sp. TaxID=1926288 RepID=UPI002D746BB5|nr:protein kinase [Noviherbaspirillum sp.]HYD96154.1 protein kinase [Noviherbaspirillum sp.]